MLNFSIFKGFKGNKGCRNRAEWDITQTIWRFSDLRAIVRVAPGYLQFIVLRNVEYVKGAAGAADVNGLRDKLTELYEKSKI